MVKISNIYKLANHVDVPFTYSSLVRLLKKDYPEMVEPFLINFKNSFDNCVKQTTDVDKLEKICLLEAIQKMDLNGSSE